MPSTSRPPSYRLHKPSGQARAILQGRHVYLGVYGSPESREKYARLIAAFAAGNPAPERILGHQPKTQASDYLVVELCAAYWQHAETYYTKDGQPSGWLAHIRLVLRLVREHFGGMPARDFGPLCLKALQSKLVNAGHSRGYVNKLVPVVPRMFKWAASEELVPGHVYHALRTVEGLRKGRTKAPDRPPVLPVPDHVVDATLPHLPPTVADMVRIHRLCGCRPGELCSMRPRDIDRSKDVWEYRPESHKTQHFGRDRVIFIGPQAQEILIRYLLRAPDTFCFSPEETVAKQNAEKRAQRRSPVQPSQRNRRKPNPKRAPKDFYTKDSYARAVRRGVTKANRKILEDAVKAGIPDPQLLPYWAPNRLRHSRATEGRRMFGLEAAQVALGHSKADVTQIYAERDMKLAAEIARKIG